MADLMKTNKPLRYIRCTTGSETYALDMASVYSIQRSDNLHLEPVAENTIGWFPAREERAPVYSLAESLGHRKQMNNAGQRVVLMNPLPGATVVWALLVDQVSQVFTTTPEALSSLPAALCAGTERYFRAVLHAGDELLLMLEPAGIHPVKPLATTIHLPAASDVTPSIGNEPIKLAEPARKNRPLKQLIVFALPGEKEPLQFALSITQVLEILAPLPVIPAPGASPYILGLVNWRSRPVLLVDLTRRFNLANDSDPSMSRLMIVRDTSKKHEQVFGFFVHPIIHMLRLPVNYRDCRSQVSIPEPFVRCVVEIDGKWTVIPELSKILTA